MKHFSILIFSRNSLEIAWPSQVNYYQHLDNEPNLIEVSDPVTIIGDIHGQFYDMLKILSYTDFLKSQVDSAHKVIFLGDYVDRGINSVEVTILLIALKINFPNNVILLRGNHESRVILNSIILGSNAS